MHSSGMQVDYTVEVAAPLHAVWIAYLDWNNWNRFFPHYDRLVWKGAPWQVGSKLEIYLSQPIETMVQHTITAITEESSIAWIDHAQGTTIEQWVFFTRLSDSRTRVRTWAEMIGDQVIEGEDAYALFWQFTRQWYDTFARHCCEQHSKAS